MGAVVGSIVSTRLMLRFTAKLYGKEEEMVPHAPSERSAKPMRPVRVGGVGSRFMSALLEGGSSGVKMGVSIVPGVLTICTLVMMLTNGPCMYIRSGPCRRPYPGWSGRGTGIS